MPEPQLNLFAAELTPSVETTAALPKRRLHVGNHILEFTLRRSNRRSIGFIIDDAGLRVAAPRWITVGEIDNAIREKQHWILTKLAERRERAAYSVSVCRCMRRALEQVIAPTHCHRLPDNGARAQPMGVSG